MYVCVCNAVREVEIREAVEQGCRELDHLSAELGVGEGCGTCLEYAKAILEAQLERSEDTPAFYLA